LRLRPWHHPRTLHCLRAGQVAGLQVQVSARICTNLFENPRELAPNFEKFVKIGVD